MRFCMSSLNLFQNLHMLTVTISKYKLNYNKRHLIPQNPRPKEPQENWSPALFFFYLFIESILRKGELNLKSRELMLLTTWTISVTFFFFWGNSQCDPNISKASLENTKNTKVTKADKGQTVLKKYNLMRLPPRQAKTDSLFPIFFSHPSCPFSVASTFSNGILLALPSC